ncbi:hypothetical protein MRS44_016065 [Fusarium solani]|uniref:uncharacterized protein n=1 Tax=Fusarium solani TaxID=169388 RepID=UPI0032C41E20|nr:hypothetical protein MRS44_016065 [Fusarium solani]
MDPSRAPHKANASYRRNPPTTDTEKAGILNPWLARKGPPFTGASRLPSPELLMKALTTQQRKVLVVGMLAWWLTRSEILTALILILLERRTI